MRTTCQSGIDFAFITGMKNYTPTALLLDDDTWTLQMIRVKLSEAVPNLKVTTRMLPDVSGSFDVYFIDNNYSGRKLALDLTKSLRASNPDALIIAFSATLDRSTLKALLNAGCNGACDKLEPYDLQRAIDITVEYTNALANKQVPETKSTGVFGAVRMIRDLLHEWNARLDDEERHQNSIIKRKVSA